MNIPLLLVIAVTVGAVVFGVMTLVTGGDPGLRPTEPDSRARPLPGDRPLFEGDVAKATFDVALRGYRMDQVDQTLRRLAYDIGYKTELIQVLEAEIGALRDGRVEDADTLAHARLASLNGSRSEPDEADELEAEPLPIEFPEPQARESRAFEPDAESEDGEFAAVEQADEPVEEPAELNAADPRLEVEEAPVVLKPDDNAAADSAGADTADTEGLTTPRAARKPRGGKARKTGVA
jgi:DivIVA domain-containing protein